VRVARLRRAFVIEGNINPDDEWGAVRGLGKKRA